MAKHSGPVPDPSRIEPGEYIRGHVRYVHALIDGREPSPSIVARFRAEKALEERFGDHNAEWIRKRAMQTVREIWGAESPPPPVTYGKVPMTWTEADCAAEQIVKEYRDKGVGPSSDPAWREKLNTEWKRRVDAVITRAQQRDEAAAQQARSAQLQRRAADYRAAETVADAEFPPMRFRGAWQEGETYRRGHVVTHGRALWHADAVSLDVHPGQEGSTELWSLLVADATDNSDRAAPVVALEGRTLQVGSSFVAIPFPMYRGVWDEGTTYERGDLVTWNGSMWHANALRTSLKPGDNNGEWKLAVQKGRDGRDRRE